MKLRNTVTALGFLAILAAGLLMAAASFLGGEGSLEALLKQALADRDPQAVLDGAEAAVNKDLDRDHLFIQLYGGAQRLAGRRMVEDPVGGYTVVKLSTGALNFTDPGWRGSMEKTARSNAFATADFARVLEARGIPYRFVLAPQKIQTEDLLPSGVRDFGNVNADAFLSVLDEEGVAYTDLRPLFIESGRYSSLFFRTDHHWRPEGAFLAWQSLCGVLETEYGFPWDRALTDEGQWETTVLEDFFLGSQGKRVGSLYAGTDDFTVFSPRFETNLTYTCVADGIERTGRFDESVCFPERIAEKDWFGGNPYTYYAGGDYPLAAAVNHDNPDGPRVVVLRESFACALTPFLSLSCSELTTIDLRYFEGDLLETIQELEPDLVLTLYGASTTSNETMFEYGIEG